MQRYLNDKGRKYVKTNTYRLRLIKLHWCNTLLILYHLINSH